MCPVTRCVCVLDQQRVVPTRSLPTFDCRRPGMDNRYATVLIYLSEVDAGGETTLPLASAIDERFQSPANLSHCATFMGISVRPRKGKHPQAPSSPGQGCLTAHSWPVFIISFPPGCLLTAHAGRQERAECKIKGYAGLNLQAFRKNPAPVL